MEKLVDRPATGDAVRLATKPPKATPKKASKRAKTKRRSTSVLTLFQDLAASFRSPGFWLYGAWIDTSLRHRAQALGAFWSVAGTLVFVILLGTLYSHVLHNRSSSYYAYLATGFVLWAFISGSLVQSSLVFTKNRSMIQNGYVKYPDYVLTDGLRRVEPPRLQPHRRRRRLGACSRDDDVRRILALHHGAAFLRGDPRHVLSVQRARRALCGFHRTSAHDHAPRLLRHADHLDAGRCRWQRQASSAPSCTPTRSIT